jgi:ferredoxin
VCSSDLYLKAAVDKGRKLALVKCSCRVAFQNCERPVDACIAVGSAAQFFLRREKAIRELNLEETLDILKRNLLAGLVLTTNNMQYGFDFICSCCSCCCGLLRSHVEWGNPHVIEKSNYVPVLDRDACSECGICVEVCPFGAWTEDLEFRPDKCLGCGVCEVNCPAEAISMKKVTDRVPERNPHDMWKKISDTLFE